MSCLDATFTLTPQSPVYLAPPNFAGLTCYGADFETTSPEDLSSLYSSNRFYFNGSFGCDPNLDYRQWANLKTARYIFSFINLQGYAAANKQLALIFGFDVLYSWSPGRVLIYSDATLLKDQELVYGDNQFLLEIDSLDAAFYLYFLHAGGYWFFKGLSGYVV